MFTALIKKMRTHNSGGFTLLEIAIALAIAGVVTGAAIELYSRAEKQRVYTVTQDRMDAIVQALSIYAESAGRVPCPGDPAAAGNLFGWERGVTNADLQVNAKKFPIGTCAAATREGIVPFSTLSLPPETAIDGWGHYFTYAVSPVFAQANDASFAPNDAASSTGKSDPGTVHGRCRHFGWVSIETPDNRNAVKARFCCANQLAAAYPPNTDLVIRHTSGVVISPAVRVGNTPAGTAPQDDYFDINQPTYNCEGGDGICNHSNVVEAPYINKTQIEAPAIILISHGPNGYGAYLANDTNGRFNTAGASAVEQLNTDNDRTYVDGAANTAAGPAYFDDIVRWLSQDGVLAAHGALSCQYP